MDLQTLTHRSHVTWKVTLKQTTCEVCQFRVNAVTSFSNPVFFVSVFLNVKSPCFFFFPFFSRQWFRIRGGSLCPLQTLSCGVFPCQWKWKFRLIAWVFAAPAQFHFQFHCHFSPASFSQCGVFGSLCSSEISAEVSECQRLEIKPSCQLAGDVHESIRRPDSWGNPERPRWKPEDRRHIHVTETVSSLCSCAFDCRLRAQRDTKPLHKDTKRSCPCLSLKY